MTRDETRRDFKFSDKCSQIDDRLRELKQVKEQPDILNKIRSEFAKQKN